MAIVLDGSNLTTTRVINSATAKTATGTAVDFTGISAGTKRITVMFNGVSFSSATPYGIVQIGSGSFVTTGYVATLSTVQPSAATVGNSFTAGFPYANFAAAGDTVNGIMTLVNMGSNVWVASGVFTNTGTLRGETSAGNVTLSGALDRVRITTSDGTTTFDAGSINILYE